MRAVVVVTGLTPGLAVIRSLGERGVPVVLIRCQRRDIGHASRHVSAVYDSPAPEEDEQRFLTVLDAVAAAWPGAVLMPASDEATTVVARHRARLDEAGYLVAAPAEQTVTTLVDKAATDALARRAGVPAPVTLVPGSVDELEGYGALASFPAIVKPRYSHRYAAVFGRKWTRVDDLDAAVAEYRRATTAGFDILLQELIPGDEACGVVYNSYSCGGRQLVEFTAEKVRNSPPESGSPSVTVSRDIPEVRESGRRLLAAAGYDGFSCTEFKRDPRDGGYKLIEVNPRHNMSGLLATRCGINFPYLQYRHLVHGEEPAQPAITEGVHWIDITRDIRDAATYLRRPGYSPARFLRPYLSRHVFAVLSIRDPGPARARAGHDLGRVARQLKLR